MKYTLLPQLCLVAFLTASPYAFGQNSFPANAVEASELGMRSDLSQEILVLRQQHTGLKAELERYGQDAMRLKRELELAEKTQRESAASIASLNASISTLSSQEKALSSKISAASEQEGNLTVQIRTLTQELDILQTRIKQEKEAMERITASNSKEVGRLNQELDAAKSLHAASLVELENSQVAEKSRRVTEENSLNAALIAKKADLAELDTKATQAREEQFKQAELSILARKQLAEREAEDLLKKSGTEGALLIAKAQAERDALLRSTDEELAARTNKLNNEEKTAVAAREAAAKFLDEELAKRRATVTKELDALDEEAVQSKKQTANELVVMRDKMLKEAKDEVEKAKTQELSQGSITLVALKKQLQEVESTIRMAEEQVKAAQKREQQAEDKLGQLTLQTQVMEKRQAQLQEQLKRNGPMVVQSNDAGPSNAAAMAQKSALASEILQMRRQLDGLKSDDLANQIRKNMTPEKK
jgi:hypothetical protein